MHSVLLNHYNCIRFYWIICQNIDRFREAILNSDDFPPGFRPHACGGGGVLTWIIFSGIERIQGLFSITVLSDLNIYLVFQRVALNPPLIRAYGPLSKPSQSSWHPVLTHNYLWIVLVTNIKAKYKKMQQRTFLFVSS